MNNNIKQIINYWLDCIEHEDVLAKDISANSRTKAIISPFEIDPFIFNNTNDSFDYVIDDEKIKDFLIKASTSNNVLYYGYPILFYVNKKNDKKLIAPIFVIKLKYEKKELLKDELIPSIGVRAMNEIGLKIEEISALNKEIQKIFSDNKGKVSKKELVDICLNKIKEYTDLGIKEDINPEEININSSFNTELAPTVYNKGVLFSDEDKAAYNLSLIRDLKTLLKKNDYQKTALGVFATFRNKSNEEGFNKPLVLPFPVNEYQMNAIKEVFSNKVTVITGPPGTGKSQFIMNLLINLFLNDKSVLFVSHTNEAVDVVYKKINESFKNLLIRTGNKEFRQSLLRQFNELKQLDNYRRIKVSDNKIKIIWEEIRRLQQKIKHFDEKSKEISEYINLLNIEKGIKLILRKIILMPRIIYLKWYLSKIGTRVSLEKKLKEMMESLFSASQEYVKNIYTKKIFNKLFSARYIEKFLKDVNNARFNDDVSDEFLESAVSSLRLWSSTLKSLGRTIPLRASVFDYVIFDEASQIDLPSAAPALYRAKNVVVVGDPKQLPHVSGITKEVDLQLAKKNKLTLDKTLYPHRVRYYDTSLYNCFSTVLKENENIEIDHILLRKHYRSEDQIIFLCNKVFYNDKLIISTNLDNSIWPDNLEKGVIWIDVKGKTVKPKNGSRLNENEAGVVVKKLREILYKIKDTDLSVGIVTPYSAQVNLINSKVLEQIDEEVLNKHQVKIMTAHKFQGSEKDIMIFSLVLSSNGGEGGEKWINAYPQILNVALSRAKYLLYIVADSEFCLNAGGVLKELFNTYKEIKKEEDIEKESLTGTFDTKEEQILYEAIKRNLDLEKSECKLIPQFVEKRYTLDLALICKNKKIDIECDGFTNHYTKDGIPVLSDVYRDEYLKERGWKVLRFLNHEILLNIDKILERIREEIENLEDKDNITDKK